ncbi:cupin domain-containing protein [Sphingomonas sp. DT-51]|uniref:cupin domain-containing protein n=1 Tax=Sphingomonas sp. DT-51 TaxID=3396165 RepID=UPI003F1D115D
MSHELIRQLDLRPHPEGGHYRETLRLPDGPDGRSRMTAILFLLGAGERSHWHRVDAAELWLWHAGSPLTLTIDREAPVRLGAAVASGELPQVLVPAGAWQAAEAADGWALVSCVVAPGFDFAGFELAAPGWSPR